MYPKIIHTNECLLILFFKIFHFQNQHRSLIKFIKTIGTKVYGENLILQLHTKTNPTTHSRDNFLTRQSRRIGAPKTQPSTTPSHPPFTHTHIHTLKTARLAQWTSPRPYPPLSRPWTALSSAQEAGLQNQLRGLRPRLSALSERWLGLRVRPFFGP